MNARDFCYWLQGTFEIGKLTQLDEEQTEIVRKHLNMVFVHDLDKQFPPEVQQKLNVIHNGQTPTPAIEWPPKTGHVPSGTLRC